LYDIFIAPISDSIKGDELVIVPYGSSFLIPYAALVDQNSRYLSETLRIRLIPSLTSLRLLAECPEGRHSTSGALLVGNPGRGNIKVEGVVGIARAFLGAGARSVIATLWEIDDEATLAFMRHFYEHLVAGQSASKSLHHAMKRMRESEKFIAVKHWAPFVLIGDDVTLNFGQ
ncbi:unnamed protein product, partial [Porites evermanni]